MLELEPQIFNRPVLKSVDEDCMKIYFDVLQLRKKLPMSWNQFRETLRKVIEYHLGYKCWWTELRTGSVLLGNYAIDNWYKFYCGGIEITMRGVEKEWNGFDWIIKNFRVQKVEKVVMVR
jgi:hypothetical protein